MTTKLTAKQERFVQEYLIDFNATQAAIRAGYSKDSATIIGFENINKPYIKKMIDERKEDLAEKLGITSEWVLENLKRVYERCMQVEPITDSQGNPVGEFRFAGTAAIKSLELLGKYNRMFTDRVETNVSFSHEDALDALDDDDKGTENTAQVKE